MSARGTAYTFALSSRLSTIDPSSSITSPKRCLSLSISRAGRAASSKTRNLARAFIYRRYYTVLALGVVIACRFSCRNALTRHLLVPTGWSRATVGAPYRLRKALSYTDGRSAAWDTPTVAVMTLPAGCRYSCIGTSSIALRPARCRRPTEPVSCQHTERARRVDDDQIAGLSRRDRYVEPAGRRIDENALRFIVPIGLLDRGVCVAERLMNRPGWSIPCWCVGVLACSFTSLVSSFNAAGQPLFSRISSLPSSHTTTHAPVAMFA